MSAAAAALKITEFLASNEDSLTDDDGDAEDWIEIQNEGPDPVNLLGWRLTDNATRPDKWVFPSLNLASGARLLVWASENDRRDPAQPLHTNFKLSSAGEYLGLLRPDGTVEDDFGVSYPPQFEDISYGIGQAFTEVILVAGGTPGGAAGPSTGGTPGRWKVPADGNADVYLAGGALNPAPWTATNYNDSTWTAVTGGVGYDTSTGAGAVNYLPHIWRLGKLSDGSSERTAEHLSALGVQRRGSGQRYESGAEDEVRRRLHRLHERQSDRAGA